MWAFVRLHLPPCIAIRLGPRPGEHECGPAAHAACSPYALLALKPGWLGARDPADLHAILRKTGTVKDYDDNKTAAQVRLLAGLQGTTIPDQTTLRQYVANQKLAGNTESFIADIEGKAHTFAAVWKGSDFVKVDETGSNGNLAEYASKRVIAVWRA